MSSGKFALSVMDTQELETAHELSVKSYSEDYTNYKTTGTTPLVKKTKSKVKTCNGKRFFNNPYYAGTPLAALAAAVKKVTNQGNHHHPRSGQRSGNSSATKLAARAYKLQLQAYQAAQARIAAEQEQQDQEIVDVIVSAESSLSRGATLGNFAGEQQPQQQQQQPQQPIVMCSAAFEIPASSQQISKNNSSFLNERQESSSIHNNNNSEYLQQRHGSSHHQSAYPSQHQASSFFVGGNELENFSFTSQQFLASQQQPQQPQQPQFLSVPQQQFNQAVNVLSSSSSSGAGSEDERQMMQQYNNNNNTFVVHHHQQQQFQYVDQQPEQPAFGFAFNKMQDDFVPPQPKSMQQTQNQNQQNQQHKYAPNTTFVVVMFKYELCSFQCKFVVCEGDWVVVQADRGEHVGRVQSVTTEAPVFHVPYQILRHANFTEIASIEANHPREQQAAQRIHQIAMDLQLPLAITDTEFYADGNKMTVFFSSKTTVDFRELQRRVFREFRRRIWLINNAEVQYRNRNCRNRK